MLLNELMEAKDKVALKDLVALVPQQPQRQDSTNDQLRDLRVMANRLGMYDAADLIRNILKNKD
jgi:hypothetical protein